MTPTKMLPRATRKTTQAVLLIDTAEALFARGLDGYEFEEAFDALSEIEQERFVDDPRR